MNVRDLFYTAVGYAVAGYLGLLPAIPPGYASPLFPASGLALWWATR